jgi:murein DD-endopeptidase MepM/ murein hydrolase activator NlpD
LPKFKGEFVHCGNQVYFCSKPSFNLRPKKTLSSWLTTRYQLIIRSDENFAERTSLGFSYSKVIEVEQKEAFIRNFNRILSGDTSTQAVNVAVQAENQPIVKPVSLRAEPGDSAFRKQSGLSMMLTSSRNRDLEETFFYAPITGMVSDPYNLKKNHLGVDIVAKANEPVKCIADGTVIFSSWTQDSGYVIMIQHRGNLTSAYKHNAQLIKKVGNFVNAGEIISIVGNSGELTNGPHLHFELWYNGNSVNPEEFINF